MKVAKLPTGKVLKFPDETPDDAIDITVKAHMKKYAEQLKSENKEKEESKQESLRKHVELMTGLQAVARLLNHLIDQATQGHGQLMGAINNTTKAVQTPRKRKIIRDEKGKMTDVEEY